MDGLESHSPETPENEAKQAGSVKTKLARFSSLLKKIPKKENNTDLEQPLGLINSIVYY